MKMDFKLYILPCIKQQTRIDNLKCEFCNYFFKTTLMHGS